MGHKYMENNKIFLHKIKDCSDDCMFLYKLQLLPNIRDYSLNQSVPTLAEHTLWFEKQIHNKKNHIYRIIHNNCAVGMIGFNQKNETNAEVSIIINPAYSGKGYAKLAINKLNEVTSSLVLEAVIHCDNIASIKAFEANGFVRNCQYRGDFNLYLRDKK